MPLITLHIEKRRAVRYAFFVFLSIFASSNHSKQYIMKKKHLLRNVAIANLVVAFILYLSLQLLLSPESEAFHFLMSLYIGVSAGYLGMALAPTLNVKKVYKPTDRTVFFVSLATLLSNFLCFGVLKLLHVSDPLILCSMLTVSVIGVLLATGIEIYGQVQAKRAKRISKT
jgi:hypothetical protein